MKKLSWSDALLVAALAAAPSLAAANGAAGVRIAVIDREAALLATDAAKTAQDKLNADMKPQRERLEQLRRDIKGLEEKFQKDGATMSERDKKALRDQADAKAGEFNKLIQQVQQRTADAQQDLLNRLLPTMQGALDELRKAGNYDLVLDRRGAILFDPELDLTRRVTERLNAGK